MNLKEFTQPASQAMPGNSLSLQVFKMQVFSGFFFLQATWEGEFQACLCVVCVKLNQMNEWTITHLGIAVCVCVFILHIYSSSFCMYHTLDTFRLNFFQFED